MRLLLIAAAFLFAAVPAHAQLVSRAEDGTVEYLLGAPAGLDAPVEVARGDTAWTEQLRPAHVVRLTSSGADRNRPVFVPGVQEGEIVFAYQLRTGVAYCPARPPGVNVRRVQCYRDFDDDGDFDGGYVTTGQTIQATILPGGLHGLIAIPPVTYEPADAADGPQSTAEIVFAGWRNDRARFRVRVEREMVDDFYVCEPRPEGLCEVLQLMLRITELPQQRARIELAGASEPRSMSICFDTEVPGDPCRGR